jgi:hypothetical protein
MYFSIPSFFSAIGKETEGWWEIMQEDVGCAEVTARFIAPWCNNHRGEVVGLHR